MPRPIDEQVVVITGASSGIGRETALAFARRGATVVVAARNRAALEDVVREIEDEGGRAHSVVTDVGEWTQVAHLADEAVTRCGRIDTWINNAAITEYAPFDEMSIKEINRVIQVDLLGQIYGTKAALNRMKGQREGVIINVASILAEHAAPLQSTYSAAKHGIKGFTDAVRMELEHARSGIRIVLVEPASINTPFFDHARSKLGKKPMPVPPIYQPSVVAEVLVHAAEHPRRKVIVGGAGKLLEIADRISPALVDWYMVQGGRMFRKQRTDLPDNQRDNLFEPMTGPVSSRGGFSDRARARSLYTWLVERRPTVKGILLGAVAAGASRLLRR